ncbi:MAG: hypothetical protein WC216_12110 [Gallionella sp.]|jgi:hypothetical protein
MPLAHWIRNKNDRPVCVWSDDIALSPVYTSEILPFVKSGEVFAVLMQAPPGKMENIRSVDAKQVLSICCKLLAA